MTRRIGIDSAAFEPWKIQAVTHQLSKHPLLQLSSLVELGKRLEARKLVRTHSGNAKAGTVFAEAPKEYPNPKGVEETIGGIADANAWMSLLNIQADPTYRAFVDEMLREIRPIVEPLDPGLCYRAGWIFVSSPRAITPFHLDHEHNFILQIRGKKRLYAWDPFDRVVVSDRALEEFHDTHSRDRIRWAEGFRDRACVFDLEPGLGGYMPSTTPHMVENGPEPSVTISFTYYTNSTRARELLYRFNARLRRIGIGPRAVGESPLVDGMKGAAVATAFVALAGVKRVLGRGVRDNGVPYAPA